ncbi:type 1 glutamine amidotransferase domain-containing protein [Pseudomonas citronellolis]|nr:type 1 glutamine amidotransferase domain-containing protein [Pseudomonas citronellolis]UXJ49583.1 type 1 glutamine amidotransferase domain-containing protein [Pseudomonas citronellolis]
MRLKTIFSVAVAALAGMFVSLSNAEPTPAGAVTDNRQILVIVTNHSRYPSRADTTGLWLTELTHFTDVVEAAGYSTVFASPKGGKTPLDERSMGWLYMDESARQHMKSPAFRLRLANTVPVANVDPSQFSAIYFTGGHGVMWDFPDNPDLQRAAEKIYAQGGVVAAVCHGVAGLVGVKDDKGNILIKDRTVTGFSNREELLSGMRSQVPFFLEDRLVAQGARYQKAWLPFTSYVVTDGRLVTGQNPQSAEAVAKAVVTLLASRQMKH